MTGFLAYIFILITAIFVGERLFRVLVKEDGCFVYRLGLKGCLGLGVMAYGVFLIGLFRLNTLVLTGFIFAMLILSLPAAKTIWYELTRQIGRERERWEQWTLPILVMVLLIVSIAALGVFVPETSNDALNYHLNWPKRWLEAGRIGYYAHDHTSLYYFLMEMLYTFGFAFGGASLAKAMHFTITILGMLALYGFARKYLKKEYALIAPISFLSAPVVFNQLNITYVDVGLAVFSFLAWASFIEWGENRSVGWLVLAATFSGFAVNSKYLGPMTALLIGTGVLLYPSRKGIVESLKSVFIFVFVTLLFSFPWYLRMYQLYQQFGNPFYPYLNSWFGLPVTAGRGLLNYNVQEMGWGIKNYMLLLWNLTMHPGRFEGIGAQIGPIFLAFLPAALTLIHEVKIVGGGLLFIASYATLWFLIGQNARFFVPILPLLSLFVAVGAFSLLSKRNILRPIVLAFLFLLIGTNTALAFYHQRGALEFVIKRESVDHYLERTERSYSMARWVNQNLPKNVKILNAEEVHGFYFDRPTVRESQYSAATRYDQKAVNSEEVMNLLINEGFTHLLYVEYELNSVKNEGIRRVIRDPSMRQRYLKKLYRDQYKDPANGKIWSYTLYEFKNSKGNAT